MKKLAVSFGYAVALEILLEGFFVAMAYFGFQLFFKYFGFPIPEVPLARILGADPWYRTIVEILALTVAIRRRDMLEIVLVVLCLALARTANEFWTIHNLLDILKNNSIQGIVAMGMTIAIIAGEIDLSVGSAAAWSACSMAWIVQTLDSHSVNMPLAVTIGIAAAIAVGAFIGSITGWLRVRFNVPTFITTLAWFTVLRSAAKLLTDGTPIQITAQWFTDFGSGYVLKVPVQAILLLLTFGVVHFLMNHTPFGRAVYAVGGNAEAARLSGIQVTRVKIKVMAIVAALAAIAGILQAAQTQTGSAESSLGMELEVIAAVIIGGSSLSGGAGRVWGTMIGLVFLGVLVNGMTLLNIREDWQGIVRGGLILVAVLLNMRSAKRN